MEAWVAKTLRSILNVLRESGASLCLLHDRGVIHHQADLAMGAWADSWLEQIKTTENRLEVSDPLSGVDILKELESLVCLTKNRWIWPLGHDQIHVIEALAFR